MGKSSSYVKKKRSRVSSLAQGRKTSKSRARRSSKFKKHRGRDEYVSYSSDSDDSMSSVSVSPSSSKDGYRHKRSRSRMRKYVKSRRKEARRQSSRGESTEESRPLKKLRGSKKTDIRKKKKSKREVSVSSASSGSSGESEVEKNRSGFDRKDKDRRRLEMVKNGSKRRRYRSRSWSSYSRSESRGYMSEEKLTGEVYPRRLKSVITMLRDRGEDKEEIIYDNEDCPPCRSNDSNDGVSKRDLVRNSIVAPETKRYAGDEKRDEDSEGQYERSNPGSYGIGMMNNAVKETNNEDSRDVDSSSIYDLESILRQKALDNLRTFRKGTQSDAKACVDQKDTNECDAKTPTTTKGGDPIGGNPVAEKNTTAVSKGLTFEHKRISGMNDNSKGSLSTKDDAVHPPDQVALASNPNENVSTATVRSASSQPRLVSLSSRKELSITCTKKKQVVELQEPLETAQTAISLPGNSNGEEANNASASDDPSTHPKSLSGGVSSNIPQDEGKEDSQFQQKTMSVMRGGEMVEVSYKVYIPKKSPVLARRTLKR